MSNTTITLQSIVNLARLHLDLLPLAGVAGVTDEPALSLCNQVLSDLCFSEIDWPFMRVHMPLMVTAQNKQDYLFAGAVAFTLGQTSTGVGIDLTSNNAITESTNTVTVNTLEPHRFNVGDTVYMAGNDNSSYNSTFTDNGSSSTWSNGWTILSTPTTTQFTFTHTSSGLVTSGAPGINDYAWLSSASLVDINNTSSPQAGYPISAVKQIQPWTLVGNPNKVSVLQDLGTGVLKIRFGYVPGSTIWGAKLVYQSKPPLKVSLSDNWAPFPDHYSAVYRQGFLAHGFRYANSSQQTVEFQKFEQEIAKAQGAADREESDVHIVPEDSWMVDDYGSW